MIVDVLKKRVKIIKDILNNNSCQKITFKKGAVMLPNEQELNHMEKLGWRNLYSSPIAVQVRKLTPNKFDSFAVSGKSEQEGLKAVAQKYGNYTFLYHLQYKAGVILNPAHLDTVDETQTIEEAPYFLIYQSSADNSLDKFLTRIESVAKIYPNKILVPVLDPSTKDLVSLSLKAKVLGFLGFGSVVVLYRNPLNYLEQWQIIQSALMEHGTDILCLGVYRRWDKDKRREINISTLCKPLIFGCKAVAHYMPYSGGPTPDMLLEDNLLYGPVNEAGVGKTSYNGVDRLCQYNKVRKSSKYEFCRVDAVLEAEAIFSTIPAITNKEKLITVCSKVRGISYFAGKYGMI